jgi:hypothetical protein
VVKTAVRSAPGIDSLLSDGKSVESGVIKEKTIPTKGSLALSKLSDQARHDSDQRVTQLLSNLDERLDKKLSIGRGDEQKLVPIAIYTDDGGNKTLTLPSNVDDHRDNIFVLSLLKFAVVLGYKSYICSEPMTLTEPADSVKFLSAFMRELTSNDVKYRFKRGTEANKGTAAARLIKLRAALVSVRKPELTAYLPDSLYENPEKRIEFLPTYLTMCGSAGKNVYIERAVSTWRQLCNEYTTKLLSKDFTKLLDVKIPTGEALKGLHRSKTIRQGNKNTSRTLPPNRPSNRIEILSAEERLFIKHIERNSFDMYDNLIKEANAQDGVCLKDLESFRLRAHRYINDSWALVTRLSPILTPRAKALLAISKELLNDKSSGLTGQKVLQITSAIAESDSDFDLKHLKALKLSNLIEKICEIEEHRVVCRMEYKYSHGERIVICPTIAIEAVERVIESYCATLGLHRVCNVAKISSESDFG